MVKIYVEVPEDVHKVISDFNKTAVRPVNMSRISVNALSAEAEKIKQEQDVM